MYRAQQLEVVTEMLRAMEDRQITMLETQNIINAALSFGMSLVFMTALGALVRSFVIEALEEPEEEKVLPVIGAILPQTEREKPEFGLWDCYLDPRNAYAEARSLRQHGWQVRVTERLTQQGRKYCVWVRKGLPERLPQAVPLASAAEIFFRAKSYFGTTTNPEEGGYILPDGAMLDFSGKRFGGTPGKRMLDHRDIASAWPEDLSPGGFEAMKQVMNWGAVRFSTFADTVIVNLVHPPTEAQKRRINLVLSYYPDSVLVVEVDDTELTQIDYRDFTYPFTSWEDFVEGTATAIPMATARREQW
jgi:hypothetical protein